MTEVRQAHMPGNYELYDQSRNKLGPVICKLCWEGFENQNSGSLNTVWVLSEGRKMVWWLCYQHMIQLRTETGGAKFLKSVPQVILSPGL